MGPQLIPCTLATCPSRPAGAQPLSGWVSSGGFAWPGPEKLIFEMEATPQNKTGRGTFGWDELGPVVARVEGPPGVPMESESPRHVHWACLRGGVSGPGLGWGKVEGIGVMSLVWEPGVVRAVCGVYRLGWTPVADPLTISSRCARRHGRAEPTRPVCSSHTVWARGTQVTQGWQLGGGVRPSGWAPDRVTAGVGRASPWVQVHARSRATTCGSGCLSDLPAPPPRRAALALVQPLGVLVWGQGTWGRLFEVRSKGWRGDIPGVGAPARLTETPHEPRPASVPEWKHHGWAWPPLLPSRVQTGPGEASQ